MGFQRKAHHVAALKPDIAVIPECGESSVAALEEHGYTGVWLGSNIHKGLGVFVRNRGVQDFSVHQDRSGLLLWTLRAMSHH